MGKRQVIKSQNLYLSSDGSRSSYWGRRKIMVKVVLLGMKTKMVTAIGLTSNVVDIDGEAADDRNWFSFSLC